MNKKIYFKKNILVFSNKKLKKFVFNIAYVYGRYSPIQLRKFSICIKILRIGGCDPWDKLSAWHEFRLSIPEHIIHTNDGIAVFCSLKDEIHLPIYFMREYEPLISNFFRKTVSAGDVIFDVGANICLHSLLLAKLAGPKGRVYAFEPVPDTIKKAKRNIDLNQFSLDLAPIDLIPLALGSEEGIMTIQSSEAASGEDIDSGTSSLIPGFVNRHMRKIRELPINVVKLDNYINNLDGISRINLIKCDVEGGEQNFFLGAYNVIKRFKPILLFEWNPGPITYDGFKFAKCLIDLGYIPFPIRDIFSKLSNRDLSTFGGDVVFYPKS